MLKAGRNLMIESIRCVIHSRNRKVRKPSCFLFSLNIIIIVILYLYGKDDYSSELCKLTINNIQIAGKFDCMLLNLTNTWVIVRT